MIAEERTSKDSDMIELVLLIIRNMIHIPNETGAQDGRVTLQDKCILAFHQVGILDLVISLANDMQTNHEFAGYLSEITVYLLRGQTPADLLASDEEDKQAAEMQRENADTKLRNMMAKEAKTAATTKSFRNTRHSRFGGAFEVKRLATDDKAAFYSHALSSLKDPNTNMFPGSNAAPKPKKRAKNPDLDGNGGSKSTRHVRQILKDFCRSFVEEAYNLIMPALFKSMEETKKDPRGKVLAADEVNYCTLLRFMMEFHRLDLNAQEKVREVERKKAGIAMDEEESTRGFNVELVASTLRREDVKYIRGLVTQYATSYKEDSIGSLLWATRLHHAVRAFHEVLMYLDKLHHSRNVDQREFSASAYGARFSAGFCTRGCY
jgi:hypothetical protein